MKPRMRQSGPISSRITTVAPMTASFSTSIAERGSATNSRVAKSSR
jgi:hypothetical protein